MMLAHFHFIYTFRTLKYSLPLLLLPMIRLIFHLDWETFYSAVQQNIIVLLLILSYSIIKWIFASCKWNDTLLEINTGFIYKKNAVFNTDKISVMEFERPLYCRLLGATIVSVYFHSHLYPKRCLLYLTKKSAEKLRHSIFPHELNANATYKLSGGKRLAFIFLSGDIISTILFGFLGWRQLMQLLGEDRYVIQQIAWNGFLTVEQFFNLLLPTGATLFITALFLTALLTVFRSFFQTANYSAMRYENLLFVQFGLLKRVERYIHLNSINTCDIRHTPFSRLIRYYPVHITAGGYSNGSLPLLVCKNSQNNIIKGLVPQWHSSCSLHLVNRSHKSFPTYIWLPGSLFAFFVLIYIVAQNALPNLLPLLLIPCLLSAISFLINLEAFFLEGIAKHPEGGLSVCCAKFFTRHHILVFNDNYSFTLKENFLGIIYNRCNFYIHTPAKQRLRIRGISRFIGYSIKP